MPDTPDSNACKAYAVDSPKHTSSEYAIGNTQDAVVIGGKVRSISRPAPDLKLGENLTAINLLQKK